MCVGRDNTPFTTDLAESHSMQLDGPRAFFPDISRTRGIWLAGKPDAYTHPCSEPASVPGRIW